MDAATANLWKRPADGGELQRATDFRDRATFIVRQVTWSPDSKFLYAAIADVDADVVSISGLLRQD